MIKKLTASLVAATIACCSLPAFAADESENFIPAQKMEATPTKAIELSVEGAIALALENNPRVKAADSAITSAKLSLEVAQDSQKEFNQLSKYVNIPVKISDGLETAYLKEGYYPYAAKVGVELAEKSKEQVVAAVSYEVIEKYYNVKLMEKLVAIGKTGLKLAEENETLMKEHFAAGFVAAIEVKNAENAVLQAKNSLSSYERTLLIATESLKVSLQLDGTEYTLYLTDDITIPQLPENTDALIENALNTRFDITAARKDYELKSELFNITKRYLTDDTALYHQAYSDYLNSEYTYNNAMKMIRLALGNEYTSILSAKDAIAVAENNLEVKQSLYDASKVKYDLGMITNIELTAAMAELDGAKTELENARVTYALAVIKFGYNTTIGL
ncbi:MAG: TolC family protein [Clostridia bacterium]|nr:TolC family protein [Clostridia bacterium]